MKRIDFIKLGKEAKEALQAPFKVRKDQKNLEAWIIDKEQKISELNDSIQELKGAAEFKVDMILKAIDDLALEERKLKQGQALLKELFED